MHTRQPSYPPFRPSLSFVLLCVVMIALFMAGGASRGDVPGQTVVRVVAWFALIAIILFGDPPRLRQVRPVALLLAATVVLAMLQLLPLPPAIWQVLPGRALLTDAMIGSGQPQPWRPWTMTPGATANAAASLIVPVVVLVLAAGLNQIDRARLPGLMLCLVTASTLMGVIQFSGGGFDNPFINDSQGQVSGSFANRNHLALFVALGCILAPAWAFPHTRRPGWRGPVALGLVLLFILTILGTGSRAGLLLGGMALILSIGLVREVLRVMLAGRPRWLAPAILGIAGAGLIGLVVVSFRVNRAAAIDRVIQLDPGQDMRQRGLPTVLAMVRDYFPAGSGLGSFDQMFRMHEPFSLLKLTYFNHAHNDFLEIALDAGLAGVVLLIVSLFWWGLASVRAWKTRVNRPVLPQLGSGMILLILVASAVDYPARTPMIMAVIVLAGVWLCETPRTDEMSGATGHSATSDLPEMNARASASN